MNCQFIDVNYMLKPHQASGVAWAAIKCQRYGGGNLAYDMGLGKNIQA